MNKITFGLALLSGLICRSFNAQTLVSNQASSPWLFCSNGNDLFFISSDPQSQTNEGLFELWKTDGTAGGTTQIKEINPTAGSITNSIDTKLVSMNGVVYFPANDGVNGTELWRSDGTAAGTYMVKDIKDNLDPNFKSSFPRHLYVLNNTLFFTAEDTPNGRELWKSDGTAIGTTLVKDLVPGIYGQTNNTNLVELNGSLYFEARDGNYDKYLWKSDGTAVGTTTVLQLYSQDFKQLIAFNGKIYFTASGIGTNATSGKELFVSDGTTGGTFMLKDVNPGPSDASITHMTVSNNKLFFIASTAAEGREIWVSDGTPSGTTILKDIKVGSAGSTMGTTDPELTNANGTLYFTASDGVSNSYLWKSDGTSAGTMLVPNTATYLAQTACATCVSAIGNIVFFAALQINDEVLWRSDGTSAGTYTLNNLNPNGDFRPRNLYNHNGVLYFTAASGTGNPLYKYNPSSPTGLTDLNPSTNLKVYPNPNKGTFTVKFNGLSNAAITVFNTLGQAVYRSVLADEINAIDLKCPQGVYYYKISDKNQLLKNGKLIIE